MRYSGLYWHFLSPMIKNSIVKNFGKERAKQAIKNGKEKYRELVINAPELGRGNQMASNAYFAYVFVGAWLGTGKELTPENMGLVMREVLEKMKPFFGLIDLNKNEKYWYDSMKKYEQWCNNGNLEKYPDTWQVNFDEDLHDRGSYYYFTSCPICSYLNKIGMGEIMKPLCETDKYMFAYQHGILNRKHTIADGGDICDYWVVGDKYGDFKTEREKQ